MQIFIKSVEFNEEGKKEWYMIELQGDLESKNPEQRLANKFIGDIHFNKEGNPILIIGHHILHGKILKCDKPFAVLEKMSEDPASKTEYKVRAIIKKKLSFRDRPKPIVSLANLHQSNKRIDMNEFA